MKWRLASSEIKKKLVKSIILDKHFWGQVRLWCQGKKKNPFWGNAGIIFEWLGPPEYCKWTLKGLSPIRPSIIMMQSVTIPPESGILLAKDPKGIGLVFQRLVFARSCPRALKQFRAAQGWTGSRWRDFEPFWTTSSSSKLFESSRAASSKY